MSTSHNQIRELWKVKLISYIDRKPSGVWAAFFLPSVMFGLGVWFSGFDWGVIRLSLIFYSIYTIATAIGLGIIYTSRFRRCRKNEYLLIVFTYYSYDNLMLTMFIISSLLVAVYSTRDAISPLSIWPWLSVIIVTIVIVALVFSPKILTQKANYQINAQRLLKILPLILAFSGTLPSFGFMMASILSHSGKLDVLRYMLSLMAYFGSLILLPYIVFGYYEIVVLVINKWPKVKKSGDEFIFVEAK